MGFLRLQEEKLAFMFLQWKYQKMNIPLPSPQQLRQQAAQIVDDAHRIAKERGQNVMTIIKELVEEIKKK